MLHPPGPGGYAVRAATQRAPSKNTPEQCLAARRLVAHSPRLHGAASVCVGRRDYRIHRRQLLALQTARRTSRSSSRPPSSTPTPHPSPPGSVPSTQLRPCANLALPWSHSLDAAVPVTGRGLPVSHCLKRLTNSHSDLATAHAGTQALAKSIRSAPVETSVLSLGLGPALSGVSPNGLPIVACEPSLPTACPLWRAAASARDYAAPSPSLPCLLACRPTIRRAQHPAHLTVV